MNRAIESLPTFLKNLEQLSTGWQYVHGYNQPKDISTVHNNAGFVAICKHFYSDIGAKLKELYNAQPVTG